MDLIVIGGGDGTLNAVVDALMDAQKTAGILPLGTANDLAQTLGIPTDINRSLSGDRRWQFAAVLPALRRGFQQVPSGVRTLQGQAIEIYTPTPHPISTDGELTAQTPIRVWSRRTASKAIYSQISLK